MADVLEDARHALAHWSLNVKEDDARTFVDLGLKGMSKIPVVGAAASSALGVVIGTVWPPKDKETERFKESEKRVTERVQDMIRMGLDERDAKALEDKIKGIRKKYEEWYDFSFYETDPAAPSSPSPPASPPGSPGGSAGGSPRGSDGSASVANGSAVKGQTLTNLLLDIEGVEDAFMGYMLNPALAERAISAFIVLGTLQLGARRERVFNYYGNYGEIASLKNQEKFEGHLARDVKLYSTKILEAYSLVVERRKAGFSIRDRSNDWTAEAVAGDAFAPQGSKDQWAGVIWTKQLYQRTDSLVTTEGPRIDHQLMLRKMAREALSVRMDEVLSVLVGRLGACVADAVGKLWLPMLKADLSKQPQETDKIPLFTWGEKVQIYSPNRRHYLVVEGRTIASYSLEDHSKQFLKKFAPSSGFAEMGTPRLPFELMLMLDGTLQVCDAGHSVCWSVRAGGSRYFPPYKLEVRDSGEVAVVDGTNTTSWSSLSEPAKFLGSASYGRSKILYSNNCKTALWLNDNGEMSLWRQPVMTEDEYNRPRSSGRGTGGSPYPPGRAFKIWTSPTAGNAAAQNGYRMEMQADGNLVAYAKNGPPFWASGSQNRGRGPWRFELTDSGAAAVIDVDGRWVWSTVQDWERTCEVINLDFGPDPMSFMSHIAAFDSLSVKSRNELAAVPYFAGSWPMAEIYVEGTYKYPGGKFNLVVQNDHNICVYALDEGGRQTECVWDTKTWGDKGAWKPPSGGWNGPYILTLRQDGELVGVDRQANVFWRSLISNRGVPPYRLELCDDGDMIVRDADNVNTWSWKRPDGVYAGWSEEQKTEVKLDISVGKTKGTDYGIDTTGVDWGNPGFVP